MTETSFTDGEIEALKTLAHMIIPPSTEFGLPGAGDKVIFAYILATAQRQGAAVRDALAALQALARKEQEQDFTALDPGERDGVIEVCRRLHDREAKILATITVQCYYRDDRVMASLNMAPRPPHPLGFEIEEGDWSLLNPVRARGQMYRETP